MRHLKYVIASPVPGEGTSFLHAIVSVLDQTVAPLRRIIVDEGSNDSAEIANGRETERRRGQRINDKERIGYVPE